MMSFLAWMRKVDAALEARCGLTSGDLADFAYRDAFEDECDPEEVADEVLEENGFPTEDDE
jgi:hypothetical protein